ncbi:MAG: AAA family ATPase [Solirubrobacterales bacterium]|nr:AAA family ATPase [Solirubrobacterales bacterium]
MSAPCSSALTIRLFGSIAVEHGERRLGPRDFGGSRPKQVLEILLAARGGPVTVERLAEMLWGEGVPGNFAASIQTFVSTLRRHLCADTGCARELIVTERGAYRFAVEHADIDLDRFDRLLARAGRAPSESARRCLIDALSLATAEVLEDEPYADWAEDLRGTYRGRLIGANLEAADAALIARDYQAALEHAQAAGRLDPFSERAHRTGMLALYAMGRAHEALQGYRRLRALLVNELGLEPSAETRSLEAAILRQDDASSLFPRPSRAMQLRSSGQPWLLFLGRRAELDLLGQCFGSAVGGEFAMVLVEGEAGIGKSRLLDEFASTLDGMRVGRARCSALEEHLARVPLAAALREVLDQLDLDLDRLPALRGLLPELALGERPALFAEVDVLEAIVEVIRRNAPLVLFLDDLHLADVGTIAALEYLHRRCANCPVMVVGALRDDETPPDHPVRRLGVTERILLEPLTEHELAPLAIPDVHLRTGGHPALVASLIAGRSGPDLRSSLSELFVSRCRAEGAAAFRILLTAATLPEPFEPEVLAALLESDPITLIERLEQLCDRRILRVEGLRFRFRYAIVRDVLAAEVSPARCRLLRDRAEIFRKRREIVRAAGRDAPLISSAVTRS